MARVFDVYGSILRISGFFKFLHDGLVGLGIKDQEETERVDRALQDERFCSDVAKLIAGVAVVRYLDIDEIARNPGASQSMRLQAISEIHAQQSSLPTMSTRAEDIEGRLRELTSDPDHKVRVAAVMCIDDVGWLMDCAISHRSGRDAASVAVAQLKKFNADGCLKRVALRANYPQIRHEATDALGRETVASWAKQADNEGSEKDWIEILASLFGTNPNENRGALCNIVERGGYRPATAAAVQILDGMTANATRGA